MFINLPKKPNCDDVNTEQINILPDSENIFESSGTNCDRPLLICYTNADQMLNKREELKELVTSKNHRCNSNY